MEISPSVQALLMLLCAALGAAVGVAVDVFSELCAPMPKKLRSVAVFITDLCCVGFAFVGIVVLSFYFDKGRLRFFDFLGCACGFLGYRATLSFLVRALLCRVLRLMSALFRILAVPCRILWKKINKSFKICKYYIFKSLEKSKYMLYNIYNNIKLLKWAEYGFMPKRRNKN